MAKQLRIRTVSAITFDADTIRSYWDKDPELLEKCLVAFEELSNESELWEEEYSFAPETPKFAIIRELRSFAENIANRADEFESREFTILGDDGIEDAEIY